MAATRVLILGHSFVHRLHSFIDSSSSPVLTLSLGLEERINVKWRGIGGRTIAKVFQYDLHIVESFKPQVVVLELGTNDLSHLTPTTVGSSLEDLTLGFIFALCCPTSVPPAKNIFWRHLTHNRIITPNRP